MTIKLRTRYRIVFLYYETRNGKCLKDITPEFYKLSGATDGDAFEEYKNFAMEVLDTIPSKCIIEDGSGICIATYIMKEKFIFKEKLVIEEYVYKARVGYVFKTRKDGAKLAYKVNQKTGKKTPTNYKKAKRNYSSQQRRIRVKKQKHTVRQLKRKKAYDMRKSEKEAFHRATKKKVVKQFERYAGCYSKDMAYKGR